MTENSSFENDRQDSQPYEIPSQGSRPYSTQATSTDSRQWPQQSHSVDLGLDLAVFDELYQDIDLNSFFASESFLPSPIGLLNPPVIPVEQSLPYHTTTAPQTPSTWQPPTPSSSSGSGDLAYEPRYLENAAVPQNPWFFDFAQSIAPLHHVPQGLAFR